MRGTGANFATGIAVFHPLPTSTAVAIRRCRLTYPADRVTANRPYSRSCLSATVSICCSSTTRTYSDNFLRSSRASNSNVSRSCGGSHTSMREVFFSFVTNKEGARAAPRTAAGRSPPSHHHVFPAGKLCRLQSPYLGFTDCRLEKTGHAARSLMWLLATGLYRGVSDRTRAASRLCCNGG